MIAGVIIMLLVSSLLCFLSMVEKKPVNAILLALYSIIGVLLAILVVIFTKLE